MSLNHSSTLLDYCLDNREAKPDALVVHFSSPLQFSKSREKLIQVFFCNARACVLDFDDQTLLLCFIANSDLNLALLGKFERILNQID